MLNQMFDAKCKMYVTIDMVLCDVLGYYCLHYKTENRQDDHLENIIMDVMKNDLSKLSEKTLYQHIIERENFNLVDRYRVESLNTFKGVKPFRFPMFDLVFDRELFLKAFSQDNIHIVYRDEYEKNTLIETVNDKDHKEKMSSCFMSYDEFYNHIDSNQWSGELITADAELVKGLVDKVGDTPGIYMPILPCVKKSVLDIIPGVVLNLYDPMIRQ